VEFLRSTERIIRVHQFRYLRAVGCAVSPLDVTVEEGLGGVQDPSRRCMARPDHSERVPRPEFIVYGESIEAALGKLIEKLRSRQPSDVFLPRG
jgi:hypothetical protein